MMIVARSPRKISRQSVKVQTFMTYYMIAQSLCSLFPYFSSATLFYKERLLRA